MDGGERAVRARAAKTRVQDGVGGARGELAGDVRVVDLTVPRLGRDRHAEVRMRRGGTGLLGELAPEEAVVVQDRDRAGAVLTGPCDHRLAQQVVGRHEPQERPAAARVVALGALAGDLGIPDRERGQPVLRRHLEDARAVGHRHGDGGGPEVELADVGARARIVGGTAGVRLDGARVPGVGPGGGAVELHEAHSVTADPAPGVGQREPLPGGDRVRSAGGEALARKARVDGERPFPDPPGSRAAAASAAGHQDRGQGERDGGAWGARVCWPEDAHRGAHWRR